MKANDYRDKRFGNLIALERAGSTNKGRVIWKCQCDCGNITYVRSGNLQSGAVKSCGRTCPLKTSFKTHGKSRTRLYQEWVGIKSRCVYKSSSTYLYYGAKGITMCKEWASSFESFEKWANKNGYAENLTIERIDNNKGYCPENCTWITKGEQSKNRTSCIVIEYNGETKILSAWCQDLGLDYKRVHNRIKKLGWTAKRAFEEPVIVKKRNKETRQRFGGD